MLAFIKRMKLLNKTISEISKYLLLFSIVFLPIRGFTQTSDRFLLKIVDKIISVKDLHFGLRNLEALDCAYSGSIIHNYFQKSFVREWKDFLKDLPTESKEISRYLYQKEAFLKKLRLYLKL